MHGGRRGTIAGVKLSRTNRISDGNPAICGALRVFAAAAGEAVVRAARRAAKIAAGSTGASRQARLTGGNLP